MNDIYIYIQNHTFTLILSIIWVSVVEMFTERKEENETTYTIYANFCL